MSGSATQASLRGPARAPERSGHYNCTTVGVARSIRVAVTELAIVVGRSLANRCGFERRATFLHIHRELHALAPVALHERVAVLLQCQLELLERQAFGGLAAFALRLDELLVDLLPLGRPSSPLRPPCRAQHSRCSPRAVGERSAAGWASSRRVRGRRESPWCDPGRGLPRVSAH
jgi:hypothetical protein